MAVLVILSHNSEKVNLSSKTCLHKIFERLELVLENTDCSAKLVSKEAITSATTTMSDIIRLFVFNVCFSEEQANNIVQTSQSAIGMSTSIGDKAARIFASALYSSIGFGYSLQKSFNQTIAALMLEGIPEDTTPQLFVQDGLNSNEICFVTSD